MNGTIKIILIVYAAFSFAAILLYLPKLFGFRYAFRKPPRKSATENRKISVVVPARRESKIIGDLLASMQKQTYDKNFFTVNVIVADEDDPTVAIAKEAGAKVFVVPDQTCKGDALDGYFKAAAGELFAFDAFVIVDADAVLANDYLTELNNALELDYDIFITRKFAKNYLGDRKNRTVFSNCSALTWPILDNLGNLDRLRKEMPLNLCGQGMMLRRRVIEKIGGWPYRTLTEDYELKLDSLVHGFTSTYYPYAVIYTEEALSHEENYHRRLRWLTGYAQCGRKYKRQIASQAKERGGRLTYGEIEYFFGILPILLFFTATVLTMLSGAGLAVYYAVKRVEFWNEASFYLVLLPFLTLYFLLFVYGVLGTCSDPEAFRVLSVGERAAMLLFNPFYLLEYVPIFLKSWRNARKNKLPAWRETARLNYEDGAVNGERK